MMPLWTMLTCQIVNNYIYCLLEGDSFGAVPSLLFIYLFFGWFGWRKTKDFL